VSARKGANRAAQKIVLVGPTSRVFAPTMRQLVNPNLPPQPMEPRLAAAARERKKRMEARQRRAAELKASRMSNARIGVTIAREENRAEPYPDRTVQRWLSAAKKG
jgi:hypothetical protein